MSEQQWLYLALAVVAAVVAVAILLATRKRPAALAGKAREDKRPPVATVDKRADKATHKADQKFAHKGDKKPDVARATVEKASAWSDGLARTRGGFVARIAGLLGRKEIDAALLGEMEEVLLTADIGVRTSQRLFDAVKARLDKDGLKSADTVWEAIESESRKILDRPAPPIDLDKSKPFVVLVIGVNGAGKTTTIGKLASRWIGEGRRVLLAAGDTFRAAAVEQLEVWAKRAGTDVVKGKEGGDPSSVIFDAVKRAKAEGYDVVIADTAGRLQTKTNLMEELQKIRRVIQKVDPTAPHETLLVLDATNGQNAISQAQLFKDAMGITGIVLTKLDGTAKGGVILGICEEMAIPVRFVGIGEKVGDLREFDPQAFVEALFEHQVEAGA